MSVESQLAVLFDNNCIERITVHTWIQKVQSPSLPPSFSAKRISLSCFVSYL